MTNSLLFDPTSYDPEHFDPETRRLLRALIEWFESRGKKRLLEDDLEAVWPDDFLEFVKREKLFAKFLTPRRPGWRRSGQALGCRTQRRPQ